MKGKLTGYYAIFLGISVMGMWIAILISDKIPEGHTELSFHLLSEILMALLCVSGGLLQLIKNRSPAPVSATGFGMALYSVLNAAGYYGERGDYAFSALFATLFLVTSLALIAQINHFYSPFDRIRNKKY